MDRLSIRSLAKQTGADRASVKKWCEGITDEAQALEIIRERQKHRQQRGIDSKTGLPWVQARLREDTLRLRMQNDEQSRLMGEAWVSVEDHQEVLSLLIGALEQLPNKARSELGLTPGQAAGIQRLLDDARSACAKDLRNRYPKEARPNESAIKFEAKTELPGELHEGPNNN